MVHNYVKQNSVMSVVFSDYRNFNPDIMSSFKGIPVAEVNEHKKFIDFTRYYIMYRGPRKGRGNVTLKRDAIKADIYEYTIDNIIRKRKEREDYLRYGPV